MTTDAPNSTRRRLGLALRIVASVGLLTALFMTRDLGVALETARALPIWIGVLAVALFALRNLCHAVRWWYVLRGFGGRASFAWVHRTVYVGASAMIILPSSIGGDVVRSGLARRAGLSLARAATSVVVDRGIGLGALGLLVAIGSAWMPESLLPPEVRRLGSWLAAGSAIVGILWYARRGRMADLTWILPSIVLSLAGHVVALGAIVAFARGVGIDAPTLGIAGCAVVAWIASLAPVSIGGFGVREAVLVTLLGRLGVAADDALAVTLLWSALILVQAAVGAIALSTARADHSIVVAGSNP